MMRLLGWSVGLLLLAGLGGCQSSMMTRADGPASTPAPGKALIVFLRPSTFGGAIQSSIYDTHEGEDTFIGIVSTKTKVAYEAEPGEHLFMVVAENADFMIAHLDAGKTYYALVSPRMGVWKARFSLLPIHNAADAKYSLQSDDFQKWTSRTDWMRTTPEALQWYREHAADIRNKKLDYLRKWDKADATQKAELTLLREDGV